MAEYYPLLAKAIGSLPNSTAESRRVIYERARKALIGQLRTLHPPVPDEDIERESVELDRAVERLEGEIANGIASAATSGLPPSTVAAEPPKPPPASSAEGGAIGPAAKRPLPPPRPKPPLAPRPSLAPKPPLGAKPPAFKPPASRTQVPAAPDADPAAAGEPRPSPGAPSFVAPGPTAAAPASPPSPTAFSPPPEASAPGEVSPGAAAPIPSAPGEEGKRLKPPQRPIAPQPATATGPQRRLWIIPVVVVVVAAAVGYVAWKLRDHPGTMARTKPAEQSETDTGKIAERVGGPEKPASPAPGESSPDAQPSAARQPAAAGQTQPAAPSNPELPVAHRAALLVEAPDEPNKVKTFVGTVVWKLNNAPQGASAAVGLAVEADIDLPDDKTKVIVTFEKNSDASLPASHTIKIRFVVEPGSFSGNVKQISVPQMRPEASPNGDPLAGVTVQIVPNSFLVGLSPGNAEAANTELMRQRQWVDIPILLDNGRIAKLTFEKGSSGQRDLNEAFEAWQK